MNFNEFVIREMSYENIYYQQAAINRDHCFPLFSLNKNLLLIQE